MGKFARNDLILHLFRFQKTPANFLKELCIFAKINTFTYISDLIRLMRISAFRAMKHFLFCNSLNWLRATQKCIRGDPLSTYAKFSEKLTFLTTWYAHIRMRIRALEMLIFWKILRTYLIDDPYLKTIPIIYYGAFNYLIKNRWL